MPAPAPQTVLDFWLNEVGPEGWYAGGGAGRRIREPVHGPVGEGAQGRARVSWQTSPEGIAGLYHPHRPVSPQHVPRRQAAPLPPTVWPASAEQAIHRRWDLRVPEPERQFFYLPLMHSENRTDQDRCVRLILTRMPETGADNLLHARAHREVIRRFGRFPYRNAALGRETTAEEKAYLAEGGYGATVGTAAGGLTAQVQTPFPPCHAARAWPSASTRVDAWRKMV
jgi:uncharacterized protein (DUF924 family)